MKTAHKTLAAVSPIPLYTQIKDILRTRILDGTYAPHEKMPSEAELMKAFSVSRITIRQALGDLVKEGLIFTIHGKGTFVAKPKVPQDLTRLEGFVEAMAGKGYETHSQLLSMKKFLPEKNIATKLKVRRGEEIWEIKRLSYLNREPVSYEVTYVPQDIGDRLAGVNLANRDIFSIIENDLGLFLNVAELDIEATSADAALAKLLKVEEGSPVLRIERLTFSDHQPIDYEYLYYRGDAFRYRVLVERKHGNRFIP